jgi:uncharacterized protein with GYD domain
MAYYLVQATYTPQAWAAMLKNPEPRTNALQPVVQRLGGKMESSFLAFGEYDTVGILNMPTNVDMAAFAIAAAAGGGMKSIKTTPLMTVEEGQRAMAKAVQSGYVPPQAG